MADEMKKWEYRVLSVGTFWSGVGDDELESILNEWGEQGWELVSFRTIESSNKATLVAKRPLTRETMRWRSMPH